MIGNLNNHKENCPKILDKKLPCTCEPIEKTPSPAEKPVEQQKALPVSEDWENGQKAQPVEECCEKCDGTVSSSDGSSYKTCANKVLSYSVCSCHNLRNSIKGALEKLNPEISMHEESKSMQTFCTKCGLETPMPYVCINCCILIAKANNPELFGNHIPDVGKMVQDSQEECVVCKPVKMEHLGVYRVCKDHSGKAQELFNKQAQENKADWRIGFDEQFGVCNGGDAIYAKIDDDGLSVKQYLKNFIHQTILSERKAEREEIREWAEERKQSIERVDLLSKPFKEGATAVLSDLLTLLESKNI